MLLDAHEPLKNPVRLQARLAAVMSMLEAQNSAVERLRAERDTANAEVEKLQLIIKQLVRTRYGAHSEQLDPDQLQLGPEEIEQSLGAARAVVSEPPTDKTAAGERKSPSRAPRLSAGVVGCFESRLEPKQSSSRERPEIGAS